MDEFSRGSKKLLTGMLGDDADKYHCSLRLSGNDLTLPALIRVLWKWVRWTGFEKYAKGMQPLFLEKQETGGPKSDDRRDGSSGTGIERPSNPAARAVGVREDAQTREVCGPDEILLQVVGAVRLARAQHLVAPGPHGGEYEPENVVARTPGGVATDNGSERGFSIAKRLKAAAPSMSPTNLSSVALAASNQFYSPGGVADSLDPVVKDAILDVAGNGERERQLTGCPAGTSRRWRR